MMSKKEITRADVASFMLAEIHEALLYMEREQVFDGYLLDVSDNGVQVSDIDAIAIEALRRENEMLRKRAEANE